ncbi:hypothetical protein [Nocardia salmonicida]|uniref:hypothetical protein n=1 Tax=Nocardia salmonicida TaxID=53431 RepID=UPI003791B575
MDWRLGLLFGAVGGGLVELVAVAGKLTRWQSDREAALQRGRSLKSWRKYIDLQTTVSVGMARVALGAIAGIAFHNQVLTQLAAITVGASAPALLKQFSTARQTGQLAQQENKLANETL